VRAFVKNEDPSPASSDDGASGVSSCDPEPSEPVTAVNLRGLDPTCGSGLDLSLVLSEEEAAFGFEITEGATGTCRIAMDLGTGLLVVKVRARDGTTQYVVCTDHLAPLYVPATSLEDLRRRFQRPSRPPSS
jgi:hypothetical protein